MSKGPSIKRFILFIGLTSLMFRVFAQNHEQANTYPKTVGYMSVVHPLVSFDERGTTTNFTSGYIVGFPVGIHILKSDKFGFSMEIVPSIKSTENSSNLNNLLIHPGVMFRLPKNWTIYTRLAFETSGRYGLTASFNKMFFRTKNSSFFASMPFPLRFGSDKPVSLGLNFQLGINI